ncbi:mitochondrial DNA topoisomerase II [Novymonas esmeraldas]|uniref:DNA topoisomerase 2 n=1 Tax=Novymonas esmeraldas TaxID=1808958 RepID=A0AAW0ESB6_9TRYP
MTDASKYKKLTPIDHVLLRPEMYVGSIETQATPMYVFDPEKGKMVWETMRVNQGLLKIVDEILLNSADNINNSKGAVKQTYISISISDTGEITIENDGAGLPIERSKEHKMYIPEMVFGHLLTSSNYNNDSTSTTAGRHGYGAKLTNILSTKFSVVCRTAGREFHMSWTDHMRMATAPRVTRVDPKERNVTRVKFMPDYAHFGFTNASISLDMKRVLHKRIMDLAAMFSKIEVRLNNVPFGFKEFGDYAKLYSLPGPDGSTPPPPFVHTSANGSVAYVPQLTQSPKRVVGVVNGVVTYNGGTHCTAAMDILDACLDSLGKAFKKDGKLVDTNRVQRHFTVLVFLIQAQPKFDSQSKARLVSTVTMPRVPKNALEKYLEGMPFLDAHVNSVDDQLANELNREIGTGRRLNSKTLLSSITKLVDATSSRPDGRNIRTLIITEGDSAKALALNSLSSEQKKFCGVFPLRGKLLNVRNKNLKRLKTCKELQDLFLALGLELGKEYRTPAELRYQRLLIMTDQDADGSHIKGLVINAFESLWPTLLQQNPGYISLFSTPIVKIKVNGKAKEVIAFHSFRDFHRWQRAHPQARYTAKYYKGLGTSTTAEGKEYFADMDRNIMRLSVEPKDHRLLDSVFDSAEVEWRKEWMTKANAFQGEIDIDRSKKTLTIAEFVHKEMVHFALVGNARAIPHCVDGLKPSQRKILWAMLRRHNSEAAKVAQLSGYISEVSSFHHGEASLQETIVKMAQNFTGGNNINLLVPEGQFGSRQQLGSDHAAPRYIFTKLSRFARLLFPEEDDPLLDYMDEEGTPVEPHHYVPILPMLLCNGAVGIGFGFATTIPSFHPLDVSAAVRSMINGDSAKQVVRNLVPWAVGFQGTVRRGPDGEFIAVGKYTAHPNGRFHVSEIPWMTSIEAFRTHVSTLATADVVQRIADYSGANHIDVDLIVRDGALTTWAECEADLALAQRIYVNGTVFSPTGTLSPIDADLSPVLQWHYDRRLDLYKRRRTRKIGLMEMDLARLQSTRKFVEHFRQGQIDFMNATDDTLTKTCVKLGLVRVEESFDYILKKPITYFTRTSTEKLQEDIVKTQALIEELKKTTPVRMWLTDLDKFDKTFQEYERVLVNSIQKEQRSASITGGVELSALRQPRLQLEAQTTGSTTYRVHACQYEEPPPSRRRPGESFGGSKAADGTQRVVGKRLVGSRAAALKKKKVVVRPRRTNMSLGTRLAQFAGTQLGRLLPKLPHLLF